MLTIRPKTVSVISDVPEAEGTNTVTGQRFNDERLMPGAISKSRCGKEQAKHIIVVSHHAPSFKPMSDKFEGSALNGAFTVELSDYIASNPIECWNV